MDTLDNPIQHWLDQLQQDGRSPHTIKAYRQALRHFAQWSETSYGLPFAPLQVIARDIRDWKSYQQSVEKAAPSTVNQRLVALSSFYHWALTQELMSRDPTTGIQSIRLGKRQPKGLSYKQLRRLLRAVHQEGNLRDVAVVELLAGTGIRVGELLALQVGDVILGKRAGQITVRQGKQGNYREIPLAKEVRQALQAYLAAHPDADNKSTPLWRGKHGTLTHRSAILRLLNKYTLRAGLEPIGPHRLRHTFATLYLQANPDDLRGLAALLGHSDLNTVMIYTEPSLDDLTARIERIAADQEQEP